MRRVIHYPKTEVCIAVLAAATCFARNAANASGAAKPGAGQLAGAAANRYTLVVPPGLSSIANHFNQGGNTVAELLPNPPDGTLLYKFDSDRQIYTVNQLQTGAWFRTNETLARGEGALIRNPGNPFSVTFAGSKPANAAFPEVKGGFNLISLLAPGETIWPVPNPGDQIVRLDVAGQNFRTHTFDDLEIAWVPVLESLAVGATHAQHHVPDLQARAERLRQSSGPRGSGFGRRATSDCRAPRFRRNKS